MSIDIIWLQHLSQFLHKMQCQRENQDEETLISIAVGSGRMVSRNTLLHTVIYIKIQCYIYRDKQCTSLNMCSVYIVVKTWYYH
jgi:hypothetical protein